MAQASLTVFEENCMRHSVDGFFHALDYVRRPAELALQRQPA